MRVKLRHYEKATKLEKKISFLFWQNSCFYSVASKEVFQIFVPFSEKLNFNFLREQCSSKETHHQVIYRFICGFVHFVEDTNKGDVRSFTNHLPHNGAKWFVNARTSRLFVSSTKCIKPQINLWITWLCVFLLLHCSVLT